MKTSFVRPFCCVPHAPIVMVTDYPYFHFLLILGLSKRGLDFFPISRLRLHWTFWNTVLEVCLQLRLSQPLCKPQTPNPKPKFRKGPFRICRFIFLFSVITNYIFLHPFQKKNQSESRLDILTWFMFPNALQELLLFIRKNETQPSSCLFRFSFVFLSEVTRVRAMSLQY